LGEYDKETIGLQARSLAKGFRKITSTIGAERVTLICLNQMKTKIGCVGPEPRSNVRKRIEYKQITFDEFFKSCGFDYRDMLIDQPIDISDQEWQIESYDLTKNEFKWANVKSIVRKQNTDSYAVGDLRVSPLHKFWAKTKTSEPAWIEAHNCKDIDDLLLFDINKGWVDAKVEHIHESLPILDIEVDETECYFSNGLLSHNTLYGDPDTTPGGQAIPFHASVRLKLTSGVQIKGTGEHNKDEVVGIKVIATSVKNKVASPRRKCEFEIHFGIGIKESEEIFNHINRVGEITTEEGLKVVCGGNGTWKEFKVTGPDGKALHSLKFYKADFESKLFNNSTYRPFIDELMDRAFIKRYDVPTIMSELEAEEDMMNESLHDRQNPVEGVTGA
jgi:hypothetical protein